MRDMDQDPALHGAPPRMVLHTEEGKATRTPYITKDSGVRETYDTGMVRDVQTGKARHDLMWPQGVPYEEQFLTRVAELLARGAEKYGERNWEKASTPAELDRFRSSAARHFGQWLAGELDEDHAAAVAFNLMAFVTTEFRMSQIVQSEHGPELLEIRGDETVYRLATVRDRLSDPK